MEQNELLKKPIFEEIQPSFGSSFTIRRFTEKDCSSLPYWHFHPEYEIVFISNGRGKRHIADHISNYEDGDLIFLGPNLPHLGFAQELWEPHVEIVVQIKEDFLGKDFLQTPEMWQIRQLFERARAGVTFHGHTKWEVGQCLRRMIDMNNFDRLLELLKVMQLLATSEESNLLNINQLSVEVKPQEHERMRLIYRFVEQNFQESFSLDDVAKEGSMTVPAFCRFFKKHTHKTFSTFLNEFRIAHACRLLSESHLSIVAVSMECGFNNLSHFNKQFKIFTGTTPTNYRLKLKKLVGVEM
jgi:AraC-like DNA-binding protein/quercetin dioxygenase-like cupin family protein